VDTTWLYNDYEFNSSSKKPNISYKFRGVTSNNDISSFFTGVNIGTNIKYGPNNSSKRNQYSLRAIGIMFLIIYGMLTTLYFLSSQSIMTFQKKAQQQQQQLLRKKNKQLSAKIISKHDIVRKGGKTATKAIPLKTTKRNVDSSHNTNFKAAVMREFATDDTTTTGNTLVDKKTTFACEERLEIALECVLSRVCRSACTKKTQGACRDRTPTNALR
jgi:hypothetical protein